jgi:hypothetical protein
MIKEFVCPNGRMSVNGVCPIFEGDDGQVKDFNTTNKKDILEFDFMKPTESAFESAGNIINNNLKAYDSFVENKLGIPANVQNVFRIGATMATGSLMPFAIPFLGGAALNNQQKKIDNRNLNIDAGIAASDNDDNIGYAAPAKTSQGVTSAQHAAFRM